MSQRKNNSLRSALHCVDFHARHILGGREQRDREGVAMHLSRIGIYFVWRSAVDFECSYVV